MNAKQAKAGRQYDGDLQMFCDTAREPSLESLRFLRWMAEQGRLEHEIAGPSSGEYTVQPVSQESEEHLTEAA
ncbi:MAG: hypothetical protein U0893_08315 [Chloroflexota bacterium]